MSKIFTKNCNCDADAKETCIHPRTKNEEFVKYGRSVIMASEQLRQNQIANLWQVTDFVANHITAQRKAGNGNTYNMIEALAKLRREIQEAEMFYECEG
jgi:hypothetical protein